MESLKHFSFEEKVDLDTIVLSPSDVYSNKGVQELKSGIKEEQFEDDTDIIDNSDQQSSSIVNEPKSIVNEHEFKEPMLNESNEDLMIDSQIFDHGKSILPSNDKTRSARNKNRFQNI
jgi:hypothetical protein